MLSVKKFFGKSQFDTYTKRIFQLFDVCMTDFEKMKMNKQKSSSIWKLEDL